MTQPKYRLKSKLIEAADRVWRAFLNYGPVDDGRPEGDDFDEALLSLRLVAKRYQYQADAERKALVGIVNLADSIQGHALSNQSELSRLIDHAREVLKNSDLEVKALEDKS